MQTVEKWASRSDAWTPDDDNRLAELVLGHIRSGSTQLKAFEEAANLLGRTPAACGYRWNGVVRKTYKKEIDAAKKARKQSSGESTSYTPQSNDNTANVQNAEPVATATSDSMRDVIEFLTTYDEQYHKLRSYLTQIEQEKHALEIQVHHLQEQLSHNTVVESVEKVVSPAQLEEDSRTLFAIMERARRLLGDSGHQADS